MVKYNEADLKEFLCMVVENQLLRDKKLTKPFRRYMVRIKESGKRSFNIELTYTGLKDEFLYETKFYISAKSFKNKEYDFSHRWQRYLFNNENTQMV